MNTGYGHRGQNIVTRWIRLRLSSSIIYGTAPSILGLLIRAGYFQKFRPVGQAPKCLPRIDRPGYFGVLASVDRRGDLMLDASGVGATTLS